MLQEWAGLAITDDTFMTVSILLSTCRYILMERPGDPFFTRMALQYKQVCLHSLRSEIGSKPSYVNVMSVAKALALAIDEVRLLSARFLYTA
jgi:antitoxin component HigA of HigAB toxin-antitoxin module